MKQYDSLKTSQITNITDLVHQENVYIERLYKEISKAIIGQNEALTFMLLTIICEGHILLEGVPGVAKTTMIKALTRALDLNFKRIQFTPDLLPADLIGTLVYNPKNQEFETKKGPIFANLILADEINRAPAKVQAALLEAMQEQQVTIGSTTYKLEKPFIVFATQNPIEQEGTYQLPEAQVDRFMFKTLINYPNINEEKEIIKSNSDLNNIDAIIEHNGLKSLQKLVEQIYCDEKIIDYIVNIVFSTRNPEFFKLHELRKYLSFGASPRATIALSKASRAYAFMKKRDFVTPDDVKAVALPILRHRIVLTYEAEAENISPDKIIKKILTTIPSP